jgi:uncharacterized membrane protein
MKHKARTDPKLYIAPGVGVLASLAMLGSGLVLLMPVVAWDVAVLVYVVWTWWTVWRLDSRATRTHAAREDPGRAIADIILLAASIASLAAVLFLILRAGQETGGMRALDLTAGLVTVVLSWLLVHTIYTLKYARLYYTKTQGEVEFNESDAPQYTDFAYLAFTLGMTFQVSDTNLKTKEIRVAALRHALLSYIFGTVIIATTINTLASLSQ